MLFLCGSIEPDRAGLCLDFQFFCLGEAVQGTGFVCLQAVSSRFKG